VYFDYVNENYVCVETEVCVHEEESWTHPHRHSKLGGQKESTDGARKRSGGRLWKRRWWREPRYREWHEDTM
jgi:hypothetical protein